MPDIRRARKMTPSPNLNQGDDLAVVVFSGETALWWVRFLKPGFRHCFVMLRRRGQWVYLDALSHQTHLDVIGPYPLRPLLKDLSRQGYRYRLIRPRTANKKAQAWRPFTCVEAIKRALGYHKPWVLTPWQLWQWIGADRRRRPAITQQTSPSTPPSLAPSAPFFMGDHHA